MSDSVMLDLETLATGPDAVILSIGAVRFNEFDSRMIFRSELNIKLNVDEQIQLGRKVDDDTVEWWSKQNTELQDSVFNAHNRTSIADFIIELNRFVVAADRIWAQGPVFDIVILENLYRQIGVPIPWPYYNIRDSRTIIKALGTDIVHVRQHAHDALADCKYQAGFIKKIVNKYNLQQL